VNIAETMKEIRVNNKAKGWESAGRALFCEKMLLIVSEISEAVEEFRNGRGLNEVYLKDGKPEGIPVEMADAVIRIFDWCEANDVDLELVLRTKMNYNTTRAFRHGGKEI
jgi:NTP pyrophosphatase (non-canonical NTP hydrolase)